MKKLLGIVVLGLLLVGCDNNPLNSYFEIQYQELKNAWKTPLQNLLLRK